MRIAITGSAGTGKTALGQALAEHLNIAFVDDGLRRRIEAGLAFNKLDRPAIKTLLVELANQSQAELALAERMHGGGVIEREVSQHLTVELDARFAALAHELGVAHTVLTRTGIDPLNPQRAELTLLELTANVSVQEALFDCVFGDSPYVFAGTVVALRHFQDFLPASAARDGIV